MSSNSPIKLPALTEEIPGIDAIGDLYCEFTVSHTEKLYGETTPTTFTDIIQVPILYIKEFKAEYIGPYIYIVSDYDVNDVIVSMTYNRPEYNKVLDKSEYDLSTTTIDKLGVNTITVTEHSKGYTTTFIVIGVRIVLDINARYIGPPIEIMEKYDPLDVIVELDTVDINHQNRMTIILKYSPDIITMIPGVQGTNDYLIQDPGLVIYSVGDNIRTVFYKDPLIEATTDSVVSNVEATLVAFCKALLVTLAGSSIPLSTILTYSSCNASNPVPTSDSRTLFTITEPSNPAFSTIL